MFLPLNAASIHDPKKTKNLMASDGFTLSPRLNSHRRELEQPFSLRVWKTGKAKKTLNTFSICLRWNFLSDQTFCLLRNENERCSSFAPFTLGGGRPCLKSSNRDGERACKALMSNCCRQRRRQLSDPNFNYTGMFGTATNNRKRVVVFLKTETLWKKMDIR